jgi:hypothetical protein
MKAISLVDCAVMPPTASSLFLSMVKTRPGATCSVQCSAVQCSAVLLQGWQY